MASAFTAADVGRFALFEGLSAAAIAELQRRIRLLHVPRGATVIEYGSVGGDVFLLLEGQLLAKRFSADGHEFGFRRILQGTYFGELAALGGGPRSVSIVAFTSSSSGLIAKILVSLEIIVSRNENKFFA